MTLRTRELTRLGLWWLVAAAALAGLVVGFAGRLLVGSYVVAAALVAAAMLRLVLPPRRAGGLRVRARLLDVATLLVLAAALVVAVNLVDLRRR